MTRFQQFMESRGKLRKEGKAHSQKEIHLIRQFDSQQLVLSRNNIEKGMEKDWQSENRYFYLYLAMPQENLRTNSQFLMLSVRKELFPPQKLPVVSTSTSVGKCVSVCISVLVSPLGHGRGAVNVTPLKALCLRFQSRHSLICLYTTFLVGEPCVLFFIQKISMHVIEVHIFPCSHRCCQRKIIHFNGSQIISPL